MKNRFVIARGYRGKPLKLVALSVENGLFYLANPAFLEAVRSGDSQPVGFPLSDVFAFNPEGYDALEREWAQRGETSPSLWAALQRATAKEESPDRQAGAS